MRLKINDIEIPPGNPFKEDELKRKENAEVLTQLISTVSGPLVLAVDSKYGNGKTTFIKMWSQYLKNDGYPCLYFNAWENDFCDDPIISLIGEISLAIDNLLPDKKRRTKVKRYFLKAKKLGAAFAKTTIPAAIKAGTAGVIDTDKIAEKSSSELTKVFDKYKKDKSTIKSFKENLSKFVNELSANTSDEQKPLVFFIDELDRCRPNYAIELLEKAKHLFNIEGIIFVLAMDKEQIGHSIRSMYGQDMDIDGYLRRFIDIDYNLPEPEEGKYCNVLLRKLGVDEYLIKKGQDLENLRTTFSKLFKIFNLSLRKQEQCLAKFNITIRLFDEKHHIYPIFLAFLLTLKETRSTLYRDFIKKKAGTNDILDDIRQHHGGYHFINSDTGTILEAQLLASSNSREVVQDTMKGLDRIANGNKENEQKRHRSAYLSTLLKTTFSIRSEICANIDYLVSKIELVESFKTNS